MLLINDLSYLHSNKEPLLGPVSLSMQSGSKAALTGHNGSGKSILLKLIAGLLSPASGQIMTKAQPYYVPQLFDPYQDLSIAQALGVDLKLNALHSILAGDVNDGTLEALDDDWTIGERSLEALRAWGFRDPDLAQPLHTLSGGEKTKVFLAGVAIHQPGFLLLDEPSNHLDREGRAMLYELIRFTKATLLVVSHDRELLNLLPAIYELREGALHLYNGNYEAYAAQKQLEEDSLRERIKDQEKALRKAKETARDTAERRQRLDARGKKKQEKAGLPTISMNTLRNRAEKSTAQLKDVHAEKTGTLANELEALRQEVPDAGRMKIRFDAGGLHEGKRLVVADNINVRHTEQWLWPGPLSFTILSGERIALKGSNGSGKTSLLKLMLGERRPEAGSLESRIQQAVYIDQEYTLLDPALSLYEQAQRFNANGLQEHEVKLRLNRFLFDREAWDKPCGVLSGGERMRLLLCCLSIRAQTDVIVLDEPTNNLDIQNIGILAAAIRDFPGTVIAVSHDERFLQEIGISREIALPKA